MLARVCLQGNDVSQAQKASPMMALMPQVPGNLSPNTHIRKPPSHG